MHFRHENHLVQPLTNDVLIGWIKKVDKELKSWRKVVAVDHPILRFSTHGVKSMVMFDLYIEVQTSYNPFYIQSELKKSATSRCQAEIFKNRIWHYTETWTVNGNQESKTV